MTTLLAQELAKPAYDGLTDEEALALLPQAQQKLGRIQGDDKLDLLTELLKSSSYERWEVFIDVNSESTDPTVLQGVGLAKLLLKGLSPDVITSEVFRVNLAVDDVKQMFDGGYAFGLIVEGTYNRILELATYTVDDFGAFTVEDVRVARMSSKREQDAINYPDSAEFYTKRVGKNVEVFAYLDAPAPVDIMYDIFALQRSDETRPFVGSGVRQGFIKIAKGELGGSKTLNHNFTEHVQFRLVSTMNVSFTVDVVDA